MKEQDQVRAIAELDGEYASRLTSNPLTAPDYLTSYDAIIPVIQRQGRAIRASIFIRCGGDGVDTPSQLCEALLRATGKWIE